MKIENVKEVLIYSPGNKTLTREKVKVLRLEVSEDGNDTLYALVMLGDHKIEAMRYTNVNFMVSKAFIEPRLLKEYISRDCFDYPNFGVDYAQPLFQDLGFTEDEVKELNTAMATASLRRNLNLIEREMFKINEAESELLRLRGIVKKLL